MSKIIKIRQLFRNNTVAPRVTVHVQTVLLQQQHTPTVWKSTQCTATKLVRWVLQGSVDTLVRW